MAAAEDITSNYNLNNLSNSFYSNYVIVNNLANQECDILAALYDINSSCEVTISSSSTCVLSAPARMAGLQVASSGDIGKIGKLLWDWYDRISTLRDVIEGILNLGKVVRNQVNTILDTKILNTMEPTKMSNGNEYNIRTQDYTSSSSSQTYSRCGFITNPDKEGKPICGECWVDISKASALNAGNIPQEVDSVLGGLAGITLSPNATVKVIKANKRWVITDPYSGGGGAFKYSIIKYENSLYIYEGDQALGYANTRVGDYWSVPGISDPQDKMRAWAVNTKTMSAWWKVNSGLAAWEHLKEWGALVSVFIPGADLCKIVIKESQKKK